MGKNKLVSVILPVYNVEKYIEKCIDSLINQTYKQIEILIIDDGSVDDSRVIADRLALKDNRIKVIHKLNGGVASARNMGLKMAMGDFIIFVDPDDWVTSDHVEYLLKLQSRDNADVCMTTALFTQNGEKQNKKIVEKTILPAEAATLLLSPNMYVGSYGKIYRKKWLIDNNLLQNENIYSGEGLHFTVKVVQYANCITVSNKKIYYYRRNVSTSATTKFNINMFSNNEQSLDIIMQEKRNVSPDFNIMWHLFRAHLFVSGIISIEVNNSKNKYLKEYNYWKNTVKSDLFMLLTSKIVPLKSKIRLISVLLFPHVWAVLAKYKRKRIYKKSV